MQTVRDALIALAGHLPKRGRRGTWGARVRNSHGRRLRDSLGHAWLEYDDQLVDFSVGNWRAHFYELRKDLPGNRGQSWTAPPLPAFIWDQAEPLKSAWKPDGAPELGQCWYGPLRVRHGTEGVVRAQVATMRGEVLDTVRPALPQAERFHVALEEFTANPEA